MVWREHSPLLAFIGVGVSTDGPAWPHLGWGQLPDREALRALVEKVRSAVMGDRDGEALDVQRLCEIGGFDVKETLLHGGEGRLQALLFPKAENRFSVYVDPEPPGGWTAVEPEVQAELREHRMRFRICHEVAHSFFFDREGELPTAIVGTSDAQEEICDRFASELLVPRKAARELEPTALSIVELHNRFCVSLEAAARAFADAHGSLAVALFLGDPEVGRLQWSNSPERACALRTAPHSRARLEHRQQTVLVAAD